MMNYVGNDVFECLRDLVHNHSYSGYSIAAHKYFSLKPRRRRSTMLALRLSYRLKVLLRCRREHI